MRLTDPTIRALQPRDTQFIVYDDQLSGFGVRVSPQGTKAFVLTYGKDRKRVTIGRYPVVSLAKAREKARTILAEKTLNPGEVPSITFGEARDLFFTVHVEQHNRPRTQKTTKRLFRNLKKLDHKPLAELTAHDVTPILDRMLDRPSEANHTFVALRTFLRWSVGRGYLPYDPLAGLKKPAKVRSRDRVLDSAELLKVIQTAPARGVFGQIVLMLVHTGQRERQIAHLRSEHVDRDNSLISWPEQLMKAKKGHTIPYGDEVAAILAECPIEGYLFRGRGDKPYNGWSNGKAYFDRHCTLPHWNLHDLRRTFATHHAKIGTPPHIVERILAHQTGTISPVAAIYNRFEYLDEMREAFARWDSYLQSLRQLA